MLQIIAHKSNLYNNREFMDIARNTRYEITGIMLDIIITKDKKVLVFSPVSTNQTTLNTIQNSDLNEISFLDVFLLEEALAMLHDSEHKIILNLLPLNEAVVIEQYQKIVRDNEEYIRLVKEVVDRYPQLHLYLCSSSYNLLYVLKRMITNFKVGVMLDVNNSNYVDVDFYVFTSDMLEKKILQQQIDIGKEVMIQMDNCDQMTKVVQFIVEDYPDLSFAEQFQYITNHSGLFSLMFNHCYPQKE